jgi:DnaJ-class molecular chaperone
MNHPLWHGICPECVGFGRLGLNDRCGACRGSGRLFRQIPHEVESLRSLNFKKKPVAREKRILNEEPKYGTE